MTPSRNDGELVPFEAAHLPIVRPWFDDTEVQRWLGGPDWPEMILRLLTAFQPGEEFRGQVVLLQRAFVLLDSNEIPVELMTHPDLAAAEYVLAGIEPENIASRRLFEHLGFSSKSEILDWEGMLEYSKTVTKHREERASVTTD